MGREGTFVAAAFGAAVLLGCGGGPSLPPGEVELALNSLNDSDFIAAGVLEKDENIGQGNADPWGDFVAAARDECGGEPVGFEVTDALIWIDEASSTGVTSFDELAASRIGMHFLDTSGSDASAIRVEIASVAAPAGSGTVAMDVEASGAELGVLLDPLLGGDFHVGLRVETSLTDADSFSVNLRMTIGIEAVCP